MNLIISFKLMKENTKSTINFNTKILKKTVVAAPIIFFYRRVIKKLILNEINKKRT